MSDVTLVQCLTNVIPALRKAQAVGSLGGQGQLGL